MALDASSFNSSNLSIEDVRARVEELLPVKTVTYENNKGYGFYPAGKSRGSLFAAVTPGPRVYVDPTAKASVFGVTPGVIKGGDFEPAVGSWRKSLNYSIMLQGDEIPGAVEDALVESYKLVTPSSQHAEF